MRHGGLRLYKMGDDEGSDAHIDVANVCCGSKARFKQLARPYAIAKQHGVSGRRPFTLAPDAGFWRRR